jgi:hypothetical protein
MTNFGLDWQIKEVSHPTFIEEKLGVLLWVGLRLS